MIKNKTMFLGILLAVSIASVSYAQESVQELVNYPNCNEEGSSLLASAVGDFESLTALMGKIFGSSRASEEALKAVENYEIEVNQEGKLSKDIILYIVGEKWSSGYFIKLLSNKTTFRSGTLKLFFSIERPVRENQDGSRRPDRPVRRIYLYKTANTWQGVKVRKVEFYETKGDGTSAIFATWPNAQ